MKSHSIYHFLAQLAGMRRRLTEEELQALYFLAAHPDALVRGDVASLLADHYEAESERVLLYLTHDTHAQVRVNATDSLSIGREKATEKRLLSLSEFDPEYTVRGHAVQSLYNVYMNRFGDSDDTYRALSDILIPLLTKEMNRWVQVCYFSILSLCGNRSYLQSLIDCLDDEDFQIRSSVLDAFLEILDEDNEDDIKRALQFSLSFEEQVNLAEKMHQILQVILESGDSFF